MTNKLSEKLLTVAKWLENEENDLVVTAENNNEECLELVAEALVFAAQIIKDSSEKVKDLEIEFGPEELDEMAQEGLKAENENPELVNKMLMDLMPEKVELLPKKHMIELTPEKLDELAMFAEALDKSGNAVLIKQASLIDDILLTIGAPSNWKEKMAQAEDYMVEELKNKYKGIKEEHDKRNHIVESTKDIEKAEVMKTYRPLEMPLSQRNCPDHQCPAIHIATDVFQCPLDNRIYNYQTGFTLLNGKHHPGGSVELQTPFEHMLPHTLFENRKDRQQR